jgi:hypothetical protein
MTKTKRGVLIGIGVVAFLISLELGLNIWRGTQACVEVTNQGAEPIDDLVLTFGSNRVRTGRLDPGASVALYISGVGPGTLGMTFRQQGNPLGSFQIPSFEPSKLKLDNYKLLLNIRPNEIERSQDDADPATPLGRLWKARWMRVNEALDIREY